MLYSKGARQLGDLFSVAMVIKPLPASQLPTGRLQCDVVKLLVYTCTQYALACCVLTI